MRGLLLSAEDKRMSKTCSWLSRESTECRGHGVLKQKIPLQWANYNKPDGRVGRGCESPGEEGAGRGQGARWRGTMARGAENRGVSG